MITYGPDITSQYRRAAGYVDRILRGAKPADLPVQAPTRYDLVVNLKTAKALGLDVPRQRALARRRGDRITVSVDASAHGRFWHFSAVPPAPINVRSWGETNSTRTRRNGRNLEPSAAWAESKFAAMPIQPSFNHVVGCIFLPERTP